MSVLPLCAEDIKLPIKRVVLYKNRVGYFEHLGNVRDTQDVAISFTSGQLNDVLKSLTALDLSGGRITGVSLGSASPADRQLGDLRLPLSEKASLTDFLSALKGARLEVRNGVNGAITRPASKRGTQNSHLWRDHARSGLHCAHHGFRGVAHDRSLAVVFGPAAGSRAARRNPGTVPSTWNQRRAKPMFAAW